MSETGNQAPAGPERRLETREKIAESLTKGLPLLAAVLAVVAASKGGLARVVVNEGSWLALAVIAVLAGLAAAVLAWWTVRTRPNFSSLMAIVAIFLTVTGALVGIWASSLAARSYDRPAVSAQWDGSVVEFEGEISLLKAQDFMTVTVHGYPPGASTIPIPPDRQGEDRGSELFRSTTGPGVDGTAHVKGSVPVANDSYEQVEVRVYRTGSDQGCFDSEPGKAPTACIQVWIHPQPPLVTR